MNEINLKEKAILELLREGKKQGENPIRLNHQLRYLSDNNLFALYIDVFGHAVGEEEVRS